MPTPPRPLMLTLGLLLAACAPATNATPTPAPSDAAPASGVEVPAVKGTPNPNLISRDVLFGNPEKTGAELSPDGEQLLYLAPVDGVLNVFVGSVDDVDAAKPVTQDEGRGIRSAWWSLTGNHILYIQDKGGDENWHLYRALPGGGEVEDLTPFAGVAAQMIGASDERPDVILVGMNDRDPAMHDVYEVEISTGKRKLLVENDQSFVGFVADSELAVRYALQPTPEGGFLVKKKTKKGWEDSDTISQEDALTTAPLNFDRKGQTFYMLDSRGRETAALVARNEKTGKTQLLAKDAKAGISSILVDGETLEPVAVRINYDKPRWEIIDEERVKADFDALRAVDPGEFAVVGQTKKDDKWMVVYYSDTGASKYYVYDREKKAATFLFTTNSKLEGLDLSPMHPRVIESRDGLELVSYLTLPHDSDPDADGRPDAPVPLVLLVHGGPWARDSWGYNPYHQWLANRGYAVLSVNFRGSTGFTKSFTNAGDKQWAGKMHDDLLDAVRWAVDEKITNEDSVAIMGGSYGGYSTLVGLTFTPETFACGVDIVGPSNLITLLETIPPYWKPMRATFSTRVGDPTTEEGRKLLQERSPLGRADAIVRPLLIGQGANDPRVKQAEADQIVDAMREKNIPVTYVLYPDEGHGFARPPNNKSFNAVTEAFLSGCLGGEYLPIGDDFEGSSIMVPVGAQYVPGLADAL